MNRPLVVAVAALLLPIAGAGAQACLGLASLASRPTNLTATALITDGAKGLDARFGFGSSIAFGGVSAQVIDFDNVDGTAKGIGIDGGLSYLAGASRNVSVCPVGTLGYTSNPDIGSTSSSTTAGTAGIAIGAAIGSTSSISFIPFGSLQAAYARYEVESGNNSGSNSDTYGLLGAGLSLVLSPSFLIRPSVSIPLGLDGSDPTYGIGLSFGFGSRR
jgi:hypothetical protein